MHTQFFFGVAETKGDNRDLIRLDVDLRSTLRCCPVATIWNHSEPDVLVQS
jgi:hypothetical protein